jgi:hypothetical protein
LQQVKGKQMSTIVTTQPRFTLSRKVRLLRTAVLLALLITGINMFAQFATGAHATSSGVSAQVATSNLQYVSVRSGDTLWSLAQAYAPNQDPRDWINQVVSINNLQSIDLVAGQRIAIPAR